MPLACFTMIKDKRMQYCKWLQSVNFPDGFTYNNARCVNTDKWKISRMKSKDCHTFLQRLLLIGIHKKWASNVHVALTYACSSKTCDHVY